MAEQSKFVRGAFLLTAAILITKALGLLFVFPFSYLVGQQGMALYSYAYVPYTLFLDLATLGIPMGISKIISKYNSIKDYRAGYRIYRHALFLMVGIGIVCFVIMVIVSPYYAIKVLGGRQQLLNNVNDVEFVIQVIAFALLVIPVVSVIRGYFQGHQNMKPSSVSQIVEQAVRVVFILIASFLVLKVFKGTILQAVSFAVLAAFVSSIAALLVLVYYLVDTRKERLHNMKYENVDSHTSTKKLYKELLFFAIPFAIYGLNFSAYQLIDSLTFNSAMLASGISNPEYYYGIYAFEVQKLIFIPVSLSVAFSASLMPAITHYYEQKDNKQVQKSILYASQLIFFIVLPVIIFTMMFSSTIYDLLFNANEYGPRILLYYAPIIILFSFSSITMSILQGINAQMYLFKTLSAGIIVKLLTNYVLISFFGPLGAILATGLGFTITISLNFIVIRAKTKLKINYLFRRFFAIVLIGVLTFIGVKYINDFILFKYFTNLDKTISQLLYLSVNFIIGAVIYFVFSYISGVLDIILGIDITIGNVIRRIRNENNYY